jgi:hypothetical protein
VDERGLARPTVIRYENLARRFLLRQPPAEGGGVVGDLTAADVVAFLLDESVRVSIGATKGRVASPEGRFCWAGYSQDDRDALEQQRVMTYRHLAGALTVSVIASR